MSTVPPVMDFIPELVVVGVDCVVCGILFAVYRVTNNVIDAIKDAPTINFDGEEDLADALVRHASAVTNEDGDLSIPYAIIRGHVAPISKSLPSQFVTAASADEQAEVVPSGVVRKCAVTEHKRTLGRSGFWYDSVRTIQEHVNDVPFCLVPLAVENKIGQKGSVWNIFSSRSKLMASSGVEVTDLSEAARLDLDVTKEVFESAPGGLSNHLLGWAVGDQQKGIQTQESMLLDGTAVTAIGELVVASGGDPSRPRVRIQPPSNGKHYYLVKDTAKALVKDLQRGSNALRYTLVLFGALGMGVACYAGYKYYRRCKAIKSNRETQRRLAEILEERAAQRRERGPDPGGDDDHSTTQQQSCVVCMGEQREVILLECGHVCSCASCAIVIMDNDAKCPVCRAPISRVAPAFIP